jgi:hypothetical protein
MGCDSCSRNRKPANGRGYEKPVSGCGCEKPANGRGYEKPVSGCGCEKPASGCGCEKPASGCGCAQCIQSDGCNRAEKIQTLAWEFRPPSVGVIESIIINFHNRYDCYKPALYKGNRRIQGFTHLDHTYTLDGEVCVSACSSTPYTIRVAARRKIECPTIRIDFVANKRNVFEEYLGKGSTIKELDISKLGRCCNPRIFHDGCEIGSFTYDCTTQKFKLVKEVEFSGDPNVPYTITTDDSCACDSNCDLSKAEILQGYETGPLGVDQNLSCSFEDGVNRIEMSSPLYKNLRSIIVKSKIVFPDGVGVSAHLGTASVELEPVGGNTYEIVAGTGEPDVLNPRGGNLSFPLVITIKQGSSRLCETGNITLDTRGDLSECNYGACDPEPDPDDEPDQGIA